MGRYILFLAGHTLYLLCQHVCPLGLQQPCCVKPLFTIVPCQSKSEPHSPYLDSCDSLQGDFLPLLSPLWLAFCALRFS